MDQTRLKLETQFTQPVRQITMMLAVVAMTTTGAIVAAPSVLPIFFANLWLNGFIVLVFFIGVASCFAQVFQLISSVRWIENFVANRVRLTAKVPKVLAPLATLLGTRSSQMKIAATSTQSILDSVSTRIEEAREISARANLRLRPQQQLWAEERRVPAHSVEHGRQERMNRCTSAVLTHG